MKQYDVFISYSRCDIDEADRLCAELDAAGVKYWIDRNIHGSANFLSEITARIRQCRVVLFIASNNSASSEWTQKEILYALKRQKTIIPYRIGEFSFESNDELDFVFSNVQWLESRFDVVRDICEICGIEQAKPQPSVEEMATLREEEAKRAKEHEELERKVAELQRQIELQTKQQRKQSQEQSENRGDEQSKQRTRPLITIKRPIRWVVTSTLVLCVAIFGIAQYNHQIDKAEAELIAQEQRLVEENRQARERAEQEAKLLAEERAKREDIAAREAAAKANEEHLAREEAERKAAQEAEEQRIAEEQAERERIDKLIREAEERRAEAERKARAEAEAKRKAEAERIAAEKAEAERKAEEQEEQLKKDIAKWVSLGDKAFMNKDYTEAVKWYRKAAEQGNATAQNYLGFCYEHGQGVTQDYAEAVKWYRKADEQGNTMSQFFLGQRYHDSKNYTEAFKWFKKSAEQGNTYAQNWMGHYYEFGIGVQKNKETAIEWYKKSAQSGLDTSAKEHLERLGVKY